MQRHEVTTLTRWGHKNLQDEVSVKWFTVGMKWKHTRGKKKALKVGLYIFIYFSVVICVCLVRQNNKVWHA